MVHWKAGHFAALTKRQARRFFMEDPTFRNNTWMTAKAIDDEASGYFLVPPGDLPAGWQTVPASEAATIFGKGHSGNSDEDETTECSKKTGSKCQARPGMAGYSFHAMLCSLSVSDTPLVPMSSAGPTPGFTVTYNQRESDQPSSYNFTNFGANWVSTLVSYVIENSPGVAGSSIELRLLNGGGEEFSNYGAATGEYEMQRDSRATLRRVPASGALLRYERILPGGVTFTYGHITGSRIFLSEIKDAQGNKLRYRYDADEGIPAPLPGRLRRIYTTENRFAEFSYTSANPYRVTKITDPWGRTASFAYDANAWLAVISDAVGLQSSFAYDASGLMQSMTTPYGTTSFATGKPKTSYGLIAWIEATDPLGDTERCEMNLSGAQTGVPDSFSGAVPSVPGYNFDTGDNDDRNSFYWDREAWHQVAGLTGAAKYAKAHLYHWLQPKSGTDESTGVLQAEKPPLEGRIWYRYPGQTNSRNVGTHGSPSIIARVLDDGTTQASRREYNAQGAVTKAVDPMGRETLFEYFANGTDLKFVKQKTTGGYVVLREHGGYTALGLPGWMKDAGGQTRSFTYTADGQIETVLNAKNELLRFVYGTDPASVDYRQMVRLEHEAAPGAATVVLAATARAVVALGGAIIYRETVTDADGYAVVHEYDALLRPTRVSHPDGRFAQVLYDRLDPAWSRDLLGRWTARYFNARRQLIAQRDPEGIWNLHGWCRCGDMKLLIDGNGNRTEWKYDVQGRLVDKLYDDGKGLHYEYAQNSSRLKSITDALGQEKRFAYDLDDHVASVTYVNALHPTPNNSFVRDPSFDRPTSMTDGTGTTNYRYHPVVHGQLGAGLLHEIDGPGANDTIAHQYDQLNRPWKRMIDGVSRSVTFDALGRLEAVTHSMGTFQYAYLGAGERVDHVRYPNGQRTNFGWFAGAGQRRLESITHLLAGGGQLARHSYAYDDGDRITEWTQAGQNASTGRHWGLTYDWADRLLSARESDLGSGTVIERGYAYDAADNRTSWQKGSTVIGAQINGLNQITTLDGGGRMRVQGTLDEPAVVTVDGTQARMLGERKFEATVAVTEGPNRFTVKATDASGNPATKEYEVTVPPIPQRTLLHDKNGNLTNDGEKTYEWDAADRLTAINYTGTAKRSEFIYDGLSRRVKIVEKDGAVTTSHKRFLWDVTEIVEERDAANAVTKRYFSQGFQTLNPQPSPHNYFYTRDHLGSIREMTDASAIVRARYTYSPYGQRTKVHGDVDSDFAFTGHYYHQPSTLHLALYRAYDADLGRWLNRDPLPHAERNQGPNLFGYVANNPVNWMDPLGLEIRVHGDSTFCGLANHAFVESTETGRQYGRQASSGESSRLNNDGGGNSSSPYLVVRDLNGMTEDEFMDALEDSPSIDDKVWFPWANDCHSDLENAFTDLGVEFPGVPGGRLTIDDAISNAFRRMGNAVRSMGDVGAVRNGLGLSD